MNLRSSWFWVLGGALYGVAVRALVAWVPGSLGAMSLAFLAATPFVVGAMSMWGLRDRHRRVVDYLAYPAAAVMLTMAGCAIALFEGAICIVMMAPLFLLMGWLGGAFMGLVLMLRPAKGAVGAFAALPLVLLAFDPIVPPADRALEVRDSVEIDAPTAVVWAQIMNARDIRPEELPPSFVHAIGVPRPVEGVNIETPGGEVRYSRWEHGVRFEGHVVQRDPGRYIRWEYRFDAHSFPPGSMDEHVAIGGRYFDLKDTAFDLEPSGPGRTRLSIVAHYRVTSSVNFYAVPLAAFMGRDFVATILGLYKGRSERAAAVL